MEVQVNCEFAECGKMVAGKMQLLMQKFAVWKIGKMRVFFGRKLVTAKVFMKVIESNCP